MNDDSTSFDTPEEISVSEEFHNSMKLTSEFVIKGPMLLEPGRYVVLLGELRRVVISDAPLCLVPLSDGTGMILNKESWNGGRGSGGLPFNAST